MMCSEPSFLNVRININFQLVVFVVCLIVTIANLIFAERKKKSYLNLKQRLEAPPTSADID